MEVGYCWHGLWTYMRIQKLTPNRRPWIWPLDIQAAWNKVAASPHQPSLQKVTATSLRSCSAPYLSLLITLSLPGVTKKWISLHFFNPCTSRKITRRRENWLVTHQILRAEIERNVNCTLTHFRKVILDLGSERGEKGGTFPTSATSTLASHRSSVPQQCGYCWEVQLLFVPPCLVLPCGNIVKFFYWYKQSHGWTSSC